MNWLASQEMGAKPMGAKAHDTISVIRVYHSGVWKLLMTCGGYNVSGYNADVSGYNCFCYQCSICSNSTSEMTNLE